MPDHRPVYYRLGPNQDVLGAAFQAGDGPAVCRWTIIKYVKRAGHKTADPLPDLRKALAMLQRWIAVEEGTLHAAASDEEMAAADQAGRVALEEHPDA